MKRKRIASIKNNSTGGNGGGEDRAHKQLREYILRVFAPCIGDAGI